MRVMNYEMSWPLTLIRAVSATVLHYLCQCAHMLGRRAGRQACW